MNHLNREIAPITEATWNEIDGEAIQTLKALLAARKLVDVSGPHGWTTSSVDLGRISDVKLKGKSDIRAGLRQVQALLELRVPFNLPRSELSAIARGAKDSDLSCVVDAAKQIAQCEDEAVFHGLKTANIDGILPVSPYPALSIDKNYENFPAQAAAAINTLTESGIEGPYSIALDLKTYTGITRATRAGGYPLMEHLRDELNGVIVKSPLVNGCLVLSQRGGDYELSIGQDFSIGYLEHNAVEVSLYIEESFTFKPLTPEAAISLVVVSS